MTVPHTLECAMTMQLVGSSRSQGITLIEQVMVVAILGVLTMVALPSLTQLLRRNQVQSAHSELIAALHYARSRAATSGQPVLFCPSQDGAHCSGAARWESGWLVGHETTQAGQLETAPLLAHAHFPGVIILGDSGRKHVRFRADGSASGSTNTLRICRQGHAEEAWVVVVANSGRIRGAKADAAQAAACASAS